MSESSPSSPDTSTGGARYRGLTWDHPRGRNALEAAATLTAAAPGSRQALIEWDAHPLEGFESAPIAELAERYDLIVLDHPHLGEALASGSFVPLEEIFDAALLDRVAADAIGPSFTSYSLQGSQWALPLDAATQVSAARADLLAGEIPTTWDDVLALSERTSVALSLAGPHAFLTFASVLAGAGAPLADAPDCGSLFSSRRLARDAFELLATIARRSPAATHSENPIALLERMSSTDSLAYVPLVYGYVTSSSPTLQFRDAPRWGTSARLGSTIGGTGIAISRRCRVTPELTAHLAWLLDAETQRTFIPEHDGQPGLRSAWHDDAVNEASHDFYANTATTIEESWVRPRYDGYIAFQTAASALLRDALLGDASSSIDAAASSAPAERCLDALDAAFAASTRIDAPAARIHPAAPTTSGVTP
ncbi:extracellular solute-binding protein [Pseudoclavibacter sp. VKM Ac-2888]|uniref:extracellular solute-binding protein n=1 Tax=Pseudoclavibacter sp. VKM Ac-2888 TaxID=2783830 RepID=UPI00188D2D65|nr:extracellular solute-binding protein [Pseudoclavibacter sp. VKM Ac-2888]MBF4550423.1 extracellular solute-binding protein [Pseudoclavibacter sp. VKM Ac-2888]